LDGNLRSRCRIWYHKTDKKLWNLSNLKLQNSWTFCNRQTFRPHMVNLRVLAISEWLTVSHWLLEMLNINAKGSDKLRCSSTHSCFFLSYIIIYIHWLYAIETANMMVVSRAFNSWPHHPHFETACIKDSQYIYMVYLYVKNNIAYIYITICAQIISSYFSLMQKGAACVYDHIYNGTCTSSMPARAGRQLRCCVFTTSGSLDRKRCRRNIG
jgi:hypothetical protein